MILFLLFFVYVVRSDSDWTWSEDILAGQTGEKVVKWPCSQDVVTLRSTPNQITVYLMTYKQIKAYYNPPYPLSYFDHRLATPAGNEVTIKGRKEEYFFMGKNENTMFVNFTILYHCPDDPDNNTALNGFLWVLGCLGFCCVTCLVFICVFGIVIGYFAGLTSLKKVILKGGDDFGSFPEKVDDPYSGGIGGGDAGMGSYDQPPLENVGDVGDVGDSSGY